MVQHSDNDIGNVLRSLVEDNGDGFGCFETIEPYVNANRDVALDESSVLAILKEMRAIGLLTAYRYIPGEDRYELANDSQIGSDTWCRATESGVEQYDAKYAAITDA